MRPDIVLPCFFKDIDICEAIRKISAIGYDCAELWGWKPYDLARLRATCADTGVELRSICTTEFRMNAPAYRQAFLDGLRKSCEAARRLGASRLITQVGQDTGEARDAQHASILAAIEESKPILEEYGIILLLEPLNAKIDHKGYYLTTSKEAFELVREANHPLVKIVYDIYHQQVTEGNVIPTVTTNLDCIAHLHAAGHPGRHELWMGENDYKNIFDAIDRAGYNGTCGLEYIPVLPAEESLTEARCRYF
ncbi:MAG: TIM barrel protein [Clostridia bacterium]|nr:TIM barrel protein [Clostridia bacterium]